MYFLGRSLSTNNKSARLWVKIINCFVALSYRERWTHKEGRFICRRIIKIHSLMNDHLISGFSYCSALTYNLCKRLSEAKKADNLFTMMPRRLWCFAISLTLLLASFLFCFISSDVMIERGAKEYQLFKKSLWLIAMSRRRTRYEVVKMHGQTMNAARTFPSSQSENLIGCLAYVYEKNDIGLLSVWVSLT